MSAANHVIWNAETGVISNYPRLDNEPVVGLEQPPLYALLVVREPVPNYDPATQRAEPTWTVHQAELEYRLTWQVIDLPPVPPAPQWAEFKALMLADASVRAVITSALSVDATAATSLPATLLRASDGGADGVAEFAATWAALRTQGLVAVELQQQMLALAAACHLPAQFIAALSGQPPAAEAVGQRWTDAAGREWVVVQTRGEDGQFLADDPATAGRESLRWELTPWT